MKRPLAGLLVIVSLSACSMATTPRGRPTSESTQPPPTATVSAAIATEPTSAPADSLPLTEVPAVSFSGSTSKKTKPFPVGSPLRIDYTFHGSGNFIVDLDSPDGTTIASVANRIGSGSLTTWVYGGAGTGYFDVLADGKWTISASSALPDIQPLPASFNGNTDVVTPPFMATDSMTISWTVRGDDNFIVDLIDPTDGLSIDSVANLIGASTDSTQAYGHAGLAALDVEVAGGPWTIDVAAY